MLLFSTDRSNAVQSALTYASRSTGVDFDYLLTTARRESNLDPEARAATSSASGLFQFIESTWLETMKRAGARYGYADLAQHIEASDSGGYRISDPSARQQILALRHDPKAAALMAGELTRHNSDQLELALRRAPIPGELYIAHFLGVRGATELIRLAETAPQTAAAQHFSAAAKANRPIFFSGDGQPRSVREVYANLISRHNDRSIAPVHPEPSAFQPFASAPTDRPFHGLFRDGEQGRGIGPIARAVGAFWSSLFTSPGGAEPTGTAMTERTGGPLAFAPKSMTPALPEEPEEPDDARPPTAHALRPWLDPSLPTP